MKRRGGPQFPELLKVLWRSGKPRHVPFYEHLASSGFIARCTGTAFDRMGVGEPGYWPIYVRFWMELGFDCVPLEVGLNCPLPQKRGAISEGSEDRVVIRSWADFERYPWPDAEHAIDYEHFETVMRLLPEGAAIVGGVGTGPFEWASKMLGVVGMSYALNDCPELVAAVFGRLGELTIAANQRLAEMDGVGALRQGDDLGFRTATLLSPSDLRRYVFPIYRRMAEVAHDRGKPFVLHSCGNLNAVYDDLIDFCRIDAKHSFEDAVLSVAEYKRRWGSRMAPLGGIDVDVLCRSSEQELRAYTRRCLEDCFGDGYWAAGSGSSLTDYMPVESYRIVLDEAMSYAG